MAATKRQLAEQNLRIIHGGDIHEDSQMDEREVWISIDQVRAKLIKHEIVANRKAGSFDISGDFISSFEDVVVQKDSKKDLFFSLIPVKYVILPDDMGLYQVSFMEDQTSPLLRMPNGAVGMFNGLQASGLGGRIGYWVEKDRIYYHNFDKRYDDSKMLLKLVASTADFDADDELPIPSDREDELVRSVLELYGVHRDTPNDKSNDNVK